MRFICLSFWIVTFILAVVVYGQTGNSYSVQDAHGDEIWTRMSVSSETPFFIADNLRTVYAHPNADGIAAFEHVDFSGLEDCWILDGVYFSAGDSPAEIKMFGTLTGILNYTYDDYSTYSYTLSSSIAIKEPYIELSATAPDGSKVVLYHDIISSACPYVDYLHTQYSFNLGMGSGDDRLFSADLPVQMFIYGWHTSGVITIYDGGIQTTDQSGNVSFGSGENEAFIRCTGPTDYINIKVTPLDPATSFECNSYRPYSGKLEGNYRFFKGTFSFDVEDVCGNPVIAKIEVAGGPIWGTSTPTTYTDASGHAEIVYGSGGTDSAAEIIKVLPLIDLELGFTQIIDNPSAIIKSREVFINGAVELLAGAYSFESDDSFTGLTLKLFRNDNVVGTDTRFRVKHTYNNDDKRKGLDRYKFSVTPEETSATYRIEAYMDGSDGKETLLGSVSRDLQVTAKPKDNRTLHFQYVPIEPVKSVSDTSWLEACVERILPVKVRYSSAPTLNPSLWFWEGDGMRLSGWFRELEKYRISQSSAPDLVVGIVPPGSLNSYLTGATAGLSMDGYRNVVLLDLSKTKTHHLLHEYMHTLGLTDNYGGTYPPASTAGYTKEGHRIWNAPNTSALNCAIMYDFAPVAWPTSSEYDTLLSRLTESLQQSAAMAAQLIRAASEELLPKYAFISAVIEDSYYGNRITRRSPIFVDYGSAYAPQTVASGYYEASGVRLLADGQAVSQAYQSNNMTLRDGSVDFGSIVGTMSYALPWQDGVDTIEFCMFDSSGNYAETMYDSSVTLSANAPTVNWVQVPSSGSTLSGAVDFTFQAADADADSSLWAWFKVSTDNGQSWQPAGNYFSIEPGQTTYHLYCDQWPSSENCVIRLLVSDDGNTSSIQCGSYAIDGYNPAPALHCDTPSITESFTPDTIVIIPITVTNSGRQPLEVQVQAASLPAWIKLEAASSMTIPADAQETLFFVAEPNTPDTYITQLEFVTNDPQKSTLSIPVTLQYDSQLCGPKVCWCGTANNYTNGIAVPIPDSITIQARDMYGHNELETYVTIKAVSNTVQLVAENALMDSAGLDGAYSYTFSVPQELAGQKLAFEFHMVDPGSGCADEDGLKSGDYDFTLDLIRPNSPPEFTSLDPVLGEYDYIYTGFGLSLDLSFTLEESDGDPVYYMIHSYSDLPFEFDPQAGTLHCTIPLLDNPYQSVIQNQTVELFAVDRFGARTKASWQLYLSPYNRINNRAYPYYSSTVIESDYMELQAFCFSALENQYCRIEYRPLGSSAWTLIGQSAYDQEHPGIYSSGRMAVIPWETSSLAPGQAYEVRFIDYWPDGSADVSPPTVIFRKSLMAGQVTQVTVPSRVVSGQPFDLFIEVQNLSASRWTMSDGYSAVCPLGTDAVTGLHEILSPIDSAQVYPGQKIVLYSRPTVSAQPGTYTMTWQVNSPSGLLGTSVSTQVEVIQPEESAILGDINNDKIVNLYDFIYLAETWELTSQDEDWNPACDLHPDLIIDILDLIEMADHWLEQN